MFFFFCFKQKTAYEMRISDWSSDVCSSDLQAKAIAAVAAKAGLSELVRRFLGVTAANRRLFAIADIIAAFRALRRHHRGEAIAEVVSAVPLDDAQLAQLKSSLSSEAAGNVVINAKVDPDLIGGLVVKLGSRMIDRSEEHTSELQSLMRISY